jgi:hypothetical protein
MRKNRYYAVPVHAVERRLFVGGVLMADVIYLEARIGDDGSVKKFKGRFAWMLASLIDVGDRGLTTIERPAPRISHYVYRLRRDGVGIASVEEKHAGAYAGRHVRYRLTVPVVELRREVK